MQKHGVECNEAVYDGQSFDGISEAGDAAYHGVDTYT
jgi:hypothetical protein